jgi:hypothetical protein
MTVQVPTQKPLSYYQYETPKVRIFWNKIDQSSTIGVFKSAQKANDWINENVFPGDFGRYMIHTPEALIIPQYEPKNQFNPYSFSTNNGQPIED